MENVSLKGFEYWSDYDGDSKGKAHKVEGRAQEKG